ncbi:MAG: hypothetical protein GY861_10825 [bacterium]|nr:hypothetical protein [bacterium]
MKFITPEDILSHIDLEQVANDVNLLMCDRLKVQTIHNQTSTAFKCDDPTKYLSKVLAKSYFKYLNTKGDK